MAGILVSPSLDLQIRKRNALYKRRNESPKFRDILRKRFHARIKSSRCALIEKFRDLKDFESLRYTFSRFLNEEINALTTKDTFDFFDKGIEEPQYSEEDQWIIDEYDKFLTEEESNFNADWENQVICPLCEKSILQHDGIRPFCLKCHINFPPVESLTILKDKLDAVLKSHSENCTQDADFAISADQELAGLFLICETCFCLSIVI